MTSLHLPVLSRRAFLGGTAAVGASALLTACSSTPGGSGGGTSGPIKFWDMPWGGDAYVSIAKPIVTGYAPASGLPSATYQSVQWANFLQTFQSALASKTGPAASTGSSFMGYQFAKQGFIAPADNLFQALKKSGVYNDFAPGIVDPFKTSEGYVGIPWQVGPICVWYRRSLLDQAGVNPPTDWPSWLNVARALKKIEVYGFGSGAGTGNQMGAHAMVSLMINNGGGLFDPSGNLAVVTDRNIEAMDFVRQMASEGLIDPACIGYTGDNVNTQWSSKKFGLGYYSGDVDLSIKETTGDILVTSPLAGPHGDKGTLNYVNSIMMYKNTPSQAGTEAFLEYYLGQIKQYWVQKVGPGLPPFKSLFALPEITARPAAVKEANEWIPVGKPYSATASVPFAALGSIDGGDQILQFSQVMLAGKTDSKTALTKLQSDLQPLMSQN